jgi:hypothetical protein
MSFWFKMGTAVAALAILGMVGGILAKRQAAESQEKLLWKEAILRRQEAEAIAESAAFEERQARRKSTLILGKQRAIAAAAGVESSSGSPLLAELDSIRESEIEALSIRRVGQMGVVAKQYESELAKYSARLVERKKTWDTILGTLQIGGVAAGQFGGGGGSQTAGGNV